jgi:2-C-methyl-D-erythritol 4-phosphate cytidylyltransferase
MPNIAVILAAAGKSSRYKDEFYKKPFADIEGKAVWLHSADKFLNHPDVKQLILVVSANDRESVVDRFGANIAILGIDVVDGGESRSQSVLNGLKAINPNIDIVVVHDAARPCIANQWIDQVIDASIKTGAAILATPITSTVKRVSDDLKVLETVSRDQLWLAQTPQAFQKNVLVDAYQKYSEQFKAKNIEPTDEAQLLEICGHPVTVVSGSPLNIKITTKSDLARAKSNIKLLPVSGIAGHIHPFADGDMWR